VKLTSSQGHDVGDVDVDFDEDGIVLDVFSVEEIGQLDELLET